MSTDERITKRDFRLWFRRSYMEDWWKCWLLGIEFPQVSGMFTVEIHLLCWQLDIWWRVKDAAYD